MTKMSDIDNIDNVLNQKQMRHQRSDFVYLVGSAPDKNGRQKSFMLGPYSDSEQASEIAQRKHLSHYEYFTCPSSDLARANQIWKAQRLHGSASMQDVFSRVAHKNVGQQDGV
jgi:hypothetical protein